MTIEISLLISGISLAFAVYFGIKNNARADRSETKSDSMQSAKIMVKLEDILRRLDEMYKDGISKEAKITDIVERLIKLEEWRKREEKVPT